MAVTKGYFGRTKQGEEIMKYRITNSQGAYIEVLNYGAILQKVVVPDREGHMTDVVLGYDELDAYFENPSYFGGTVGRNANRIAGASFELDGVKYHLNANEGENNLHSGPVSFNRMVWEERRVNQGENSVTFGRVSPDGEQGFPGNLDINVTYSFDGDQNVRIEYRGTSDRKTIVNLTNHSYFNLSGQNYPDVKETRVQILSDDYTPVDEESIPTGELISVENTPMDFREMKTIGRDLESDFPQIAQAGGFDHNYVLKNYRRGELQMVAAAESLVTGIRMEVSTDMPDMQFYTGNAIESQRGKDGAVYGPYSGFCMETQYAPNAVNEPRAVSPVLRPGEKYHSVTVYHFSLRED